MPPTLPASLTFPNYANDQQPTPLALCPLCILTVILMGHHERVFEHFVCYAATSNITKMRPRPAALILGTILTAPTPGHLPLRFPQRVMKNASLTATFPAHFVAG
ncbi:hypothetical protein Hypma_014590 [Hypsizygus marmoreus]|uniref:Uncharacterized protein n=1 Tax=Hypsizygus marmoreus TaxID=39966 RepID=A0A369JIZ3_HYPMA|nr:hypothetical protein Hypma_014590 [Hypsizygus marmoreus]